MIGIDVGGANTKIVSDKGAFIHYCPLWKGAPLREILALYKGQGPAAVVMSGELADCFSSKIEGIRFIASVVREVFPGSLFYGTDGAFHEDPVPELAAANWLASAEWLDDEYPDAVLVDVGSTTTDIVPLGRFRELIGLSDLDRMRKGYLVYTGLLRTGIETMLREVEMGGIPTPVCPEHFAISADAYSALDVIGDREYTCDAPDGAGKDRSSSLRRLARVVCSDISEIGEEGALEIARAFVATQQDIVAKAVRKVSGGSASVIVAGIGSCVFAPVLRGTDLRSVIGPAADALPAYAVREVARRTVGH